MVVVDECHWAGSPTYDKAMTNLGIVLDPEMAQVSGEDKLIMGVSATPRRTDGDTDHLFDEPIDLITILDGVNRGWLANVKCEQVITKTNIDKAGRVGKHFDDASITDIVDNDERNTLIVSEYKKKPAGDSCIVYCRN